MFLCASSSKISLANWLDKTVSWYSNLILSVLFAYSIYCVLFGRCMEYHFFCVVHYISVSRYIPESQICSFSRLKQLSWTTCTNMNWQKNLRLKSWPGTWLLLCWLCPFMFFTMSWLKHSAPRRRRKPHGMLMLTMAIGNTNAGMLTNRPYMLDFGHVWSATL